MVSQAENLAVMSHNVEISYRLCVCVCVLHFQAGSVWINQQGPYQSD